MSKTLLIVDDAAILRARIREVAENDGWEIVGEAANGREAVEMYAASQPSAVTLDLVMPQADGLYALRGIMELDPDAKVVIVSALGERNVLKDAFRLGAADFIVKPFENAAIVNTLAQFVPNETLVATSV